jgi:flagellar basal-body rod modification protein FlgD
MTTISSITQTQAPIIEAKNAGSDDLDQADFLRLLTEQLEQQDPFKPADNTAMVAQMAQISTNSGVNTTNEKLDSLIARLDQQSALLADIRAASQPSVQGE